MIKNKNKTKKKNYNKGNTTKPRVFIAKNLASCNGPAVRLKGRRAKGENMIKNKNKNKTKKNITTKKIQLSRESNLEHLHGRLAS